MQQFHLPNPASVVSHQISGDIKPELINVKLPPIRQMTPEHRFNYNSSVSTYDSDMSRRPSVSSITSSGFHPSRSASPAFSTSTLEPQYGNCRSLDRLRLQAGHVQTFPYTTPTQDSAATASHAGGKAGKTKRVDRKQYSKRAVTGTTSSRVRKSDNEAGNRYCQAIDQGDLARVCREANPNIEHTAAPRHGGQGPWVLLKSNNIASDVLQDGVEPSRWNKSSVNGSAILIIEHSSAQLDDEIKYLGGLQSRLPKELQGEIAQRIECLIAAKNTRGEAEFKVATEQMTYQH
ncbi:hypothetical protein C7974DRAFT_138475 [Boeremia exigua]|uniref:uncharacterized protein n=1 Tax=Boeremia exigua TaxID=749465 RepID=UPI001E8EB356|nr:uncharacterized protein C7974DRAFT_138475 [Boeremia exigua]KAH6639766.1 hypothetical protein C7974DRAFT_138475 [Boeremia exigua]